MIPIHLAEQAAADLPQADDWLSEGETARLAALRLPKRRLDWRLGRWTAKRAVTHYLRLSTSLRHVEIRTTPHGAPEVMIGNHPAPVVISLSHRAGRALCAVAPAGVSLGCDLELIEPRSDAFVTDYFTADEQALIRLDRALVPTLLWSAKESALKALGVGLRADTRSVRVTFQGGALQVRQDTGEVFQGCWEDNDGFVRTLVWRCTIGGHSPCGNRTIPRLAIACRFPQ